MIEKTEFISTLKARMYRNSYKGYKSHRISNWKRNFFIQGDLYALYDIWETATNCDLCDVTLRGVHKVQNTFNSRVLDHCPKCLNPKGILCRKCNIKRLNKCLICNEYN